MPCYKVDLLKVRTAVLRVVEQYIGTGCSIIQQLCCEVRLSKQMPWIRRVVVQCTSVRTSQGPVGCECVKLWIQKLILWRFPGIFSTYRRFYFTSLFYFIQSTREGI